MGAQVCGESGLFHEEGTRDYVNGRVLVGGFWTICYYSDIMRD